VNNDASNSILRISAKTGESLAFDASCSRNPDGDRLRYYWWIYPEAGHRPYGKSLRWNIIRLKELF
jgi:hypothetical protein